MKLRNQKRIASTLLKVGKTSVRFDPERLSDIKEAITKLDMRGLIKDGAVRALPIGATSRSRLKKRLIQKRKGRQKGPGKRKGKKTARLSTKAEWMIKVRVQRQFIKELKTRELISIKTYRNLYGKIKGNYFRSRNHIKLYLNEKKLFENVKK
ncbi:50S ribosomal protein L19e [Candidatus Woesearchaeota archaeon]|jgi:large subunit ribosomal protein L19e|nr:50S ribosomal protein L19e [Candidatus Woesearchaeota archaeon]MBT4321721.1 50S ribosomal protein L19e [Candidatus Woesearchaeota archaeon]MBT4631187.1 50S ribosomal protein L19e [Candidatus Woesearchaeota archaeon]